MAKPKTISGFYGPSKPSGTQICFKYCPVCRSDRWKVYLDPETGKWICFAGDHYAGGRIEVSCQSTNPGMELLELLQPASDEIMWDETQLPEFETLTKVARRYLYKRGLVDADIQKLGLVEWSDKSRILVPYFSAGDLIYWNSRRYSEILGAGPKYITAPGVHPLYVLEGASNTAILVEGCFDAIAVWKAGHTGVALGGKSLPKYLRKNLLTIAEKYDSIYIMLDGDAIKEAVSLYSRLSLSLPSKLHVIALQPDQDPGALSSEEICQLLKKQSL